MKLNLLILKFSCETIYYHSILKFDINPGVTNNQNESWISSLDLERDKELDEAKIVKLIKYIDGRYPLFKDLHSHLARYYEELNKENADIGLPQKHIMGTYSTEFDSSKLESI